MLEEAIEVIRELWKGDEESHEGVFFRVDEARIYTLPDELRRSTWRRSGKRTGELAARAATA